MAPHDHNKTLGIIYGFLGVASTIALIFFLIDPLKSMLGTSEQHKESFPAGEVGIALFASIVFLSTAYGLFKRGRWARISSLVLSGLLVFLFPLGTALSIYTWWFMHSEGSKQLYSRNKTNDE